MTADPKIIVIAGCNGAGKSTLAPYLLRDTLGLTDYVNADTIAQGLSAFSPEKVAVEAGHVMLKRLRDLAERRETFAFETTLATRFYASWIAELKQQGYEFYLLFLWLDDVELAVERVKERVKLGGHSIEESTIHRRYFRGLRNFFELYQPLADSWALYDNSYRGNPILIADSGENAETKIHNLDLWQKLCEMKNSK